MKAQQYVAFDVFEDHEPRLDLFACVDLSGLQAHSVVRAVAVRGWQLHVVVTEEARRAFFGVALVQVAVEGDAHDPGREGAARCVEAVSRAPSSDETLLECVVCIRLRLGEAQQEGAHARFGVGDQVLEGRVDAAFAA